MNKETKNNDKLRERITELEHKLTSNEAMFHNIVERNLIGILIINQEGEYVYLNPSALKIFNNGLGELLGERTDIPVKEGYLRDFKVLNKEKSEVFVDIYTSKIIWNGETAYLLSLKEITERKRMEESLRKSKNEMEVAVEKRTAELLKANEKLQLEIKERKRAEKEKERLQNSLKLAHKMEAIGTLAGGIAHDFNNILTPIIGHAEILYRKAGEDNKNSDSLNQILKSAHRAKDLINHVLTFSRQTKQELLAAPLAQTIKGVISLIRATLPSSIEIRQNIDENSGTVLADTTQMHQMIMNLCVNAEHAMREKGGILEVNLKSFHVDANFAAAHTRLKEGPYLKLTIRDTGHGINRKIMERIFDPFFTTKGVGEGTGMGLSTVHGIVSSHGGEIIVKSEPGKGSTFDIFLPSVENCEKVKEQQPLPLPRGNERILLVDDEEEIIRVVQFMLEDLGYKIVSKTNSLEALQTFKNDPNKFDLVITDQTMPKMTGDILGRELMQIRPDIPVILCTGFSHTIKEDQAKAMGIKGFIMKPIVAHKIAREMRQVLDQEKKPGKLIF